MTQGKGLAANTTEELEQELARLKQIADGSINSIESVLYSEDILDQLKQNKESADGIAKQVRCMGGPVALLSYAAAAYRDAKYCHRGRKFMRIAGLNAKARAAYARALMIEQATADFPN